MNKDTIASLMEQEKELEKRMFKAPEDSATTDDTALETDAVAVSTPTDEGGAVTSTHESATDEQHETTREPLEDWEKRYKNLRASRDENLYKAKSDLATALNRISDLQTALIEARKSQPEVDPLEGVFTDEDTDALGETTIAAMRKATRAATEAANRPLQKLLDEERSKSVERDKNYAAQTKREAYSIFLSRIERAVPDYEVIDKDPGFKVFMDQVDIDGTLRKTYFAEAEAQGNSAQIIRYMQEYKAIKPPVKEDKLAGKVTPVGDGAGANQVKTSGTTAGVSRKFIDKFYDDLTRGKYKGRHSEALKIEAEIDLAVSKGHIVN